MSERTISQRLDGMDDSEKISTLLLEVEYLHRAHEAMTKLIRVKEVQDNPEVFESADQDWRCPCGTMLGIYDPKENVIRVRNDRFHMILMIGLGGWIQRTCQRCGRIVTIKDDGNPHPTPGQPVKP